MLKALSSRALNPYIFVSITHLFFACLLFINYNNAIFPYTGTNYIAHPLVGFLSIYSKIIIDNYLLLLGIYFISCLVQILGSVFTNFIFFKHCPLPLPLGMVLYYFPYHWYTNFFALPLILNFIVLFWPRNDVLFSNVIKLAILTFAVTLLDPSWLSGFSLQHSADQLTSSLANTIFATLLTLSIFSSILIYTFNNKYRPFAISIFLSSISLIAVIHNNYNCFILAILSTYLLKNVNYPILHIPNSLPKLITLIVFIISQAIGLFYQFSNYGLLNYGTWLRATPLDFIQDCSVHAIYESENLTQELPILNNYLTTKSKECNYYYLASSLKNICLELKRNTGKIPIIKLQIQARRLYQNKFEMVLTDNDYCQK